MQTTADLGVSHSSWSCFSALEQELEDSKAFIEIHQNNYHLASEKYESIIIKSCAEIEKIYQLLSGKTLEIKRNIAEHIDSITSHCKNFFDTEILMPMHNETIKPWNACSEGKDPEFWSVYHAIKQGSADEIATLKQAIYSLAGLFSLLLAFD